MKAIAVFSAALLLGACSSQISNPMNNARLSGMQTYQWNSQLLSSGETSGYRMNDMETVITDYVDGAMAQKGYRRVASNADFHLDYRLLLEEKTSAHDDKTAQSENDQRANEFGVRWRFDDKSGATEFEGLGKPQESLVTYENGTLHVAAANPQGEILWQAKSTRTLNSRGNEAERRAQLRIGLGQVFRSLPPAQQ